MQYSSFVTHKRFETAVCSEERTIDANKAWIDRRNRKSRNRQKIKNIFLLRLFYFSIVAAAVAGPRGCRSGAETGAEVVVFTAQ